VVHHGAPLRRHVQQIADPARGVLAHEHDPSHARAPRSAHPRSAQAQRCFHGSSDRGAYGLGLRKLAIIGQRARSGADSPAEK
jgi:hypothetical protein